MLQIDHILLVIAALLLISVLASKISDRLGVPVLLLFLLVGMFAGSEGLGGIHFDDPFLARSLGTVALAFIIFSGGLDTRWHNVRPILAKGLILSTAGVLLTALAVGWFATLLLHFTWLEGLLLGAIVSATDAAAVFSVLRSRRVSLKGDLKPLLEFESGSNDPMAVFLTLAFIYFINHPGESLLGIIPRFFLEMGVGALVGYLMTRLGLWIINRVRLEYEGLYPVLTLALVLMTYAAAAVLHGNGFLSVYIAGVLIGNSKFIHKKSLLRFHEGLAWLMQIAMFLALGLLVFPSQLALVIKPGLLISLFLVLAARPLSVWLCLWPFRMNFRELAMVAWVGLRGAAPIILATFPLLAGVPQAHLMFNIVFFIVLTSVLIQGTSIPVLARWLHVDAPFKSKRYTPLDLEEVEGINANLEDLLIPYNSEVVGKTIFEIGVPKESLIVLISKEDHFLIPNGSTRLDGGDVLFVLANGRDLAELQRIIARQKPTREEANGD
jgi:potassium/hydrogen antiporter